jgi:Tol biopolymer transport system component
MNESMDRVLADWLDEGPERGPREGLERTLAATRRVGQRPGWTLLERWIPMDMTLTRTRSQRPLLSIAALALLLVALFATALVIGQQRSLPAPLSSNGAIVFEQDGDLFIADQLGGTPRPLVVGPEEDSGPVFSPGGDRIAFVRGARASDDIRIMTVGVDGMDVHELSSGLPSKHLSLGWSPDGQTVLANGDGRSDRGAFEIGANGRIVHLIASDGSGARRLDAGANVDVGPGAWRPDGRHLAFLGIIDHETRAAFIADADGTNVRPLSTDAEPYDALAWSPDGARLAFLSREDGEGAVRVNVADIDADGVITGSRQLPLGDELRPASTPTWSPDGRSIAVVLRGPSSEQVGIVAADGSGYQLVGPTFPFGSASFVWAPDGRFIVVAGDANRQDSESGTYRWEPTTWSVDVTSGDATEVTTAVDSWQQLAP